MKALFLTNEFPPYVYGGAGVHVEYLSRELSKLIDVDVRCFGDQDESKDNLTVKGFELNKDFVSSEALPNLKGVFETLSRGMMFNMPVVDADVVHCHTWYSHFGGILAKLMYGKKLVVTAHSLEPLRPWKREQLGGGYEVSSWIEKTAIEMADCIIAVSKETKYDVMQHFNVDPKKIAMVYNGIDTEQYSKNYSNETLERFGIDPEKPFVLFVGRITRQKGIIHLVNAIKHLNEGLQVVLCAGAPDTPEIEKEMQDAVAEVQANRDGVFWLKDMLEKDIAIELYSAAEVFCCPSIYEPFGIINLEAMACETAVVASDVGGIKEVVVHDETGLLVPVAQLQEAPYEPIHPENFSEDLAEAINKLMNDDERRQRMAKAGRKRAEEVFSWTSIAEQTAEVYKSLLD